MPGSIFILGGGFTGLAAGLSSGLPVLEAEACPGGICSSYYVRPNSRERLAQSPTDGNAYRFEIGGGHWIFGGDPFVLRFVNMVTPVRTYQRKSSVYFRRDNRYVPYPLQNHLRYLGSEIAAKALSQMARPQAGSSTMKEWLLETFGPLLCELFFFPFHQLYTAGMYDRIAPQDAYKSPVALAVAIQGALNDAPPVGYNVTFVYPESGLNSLAQTMAQRCDIRYGKRVVRIETGKKIVLLADGSETRYDTLISTLPLNHVMSMSSLPVEEAPDPYTSVLVLNIGAVRGASCPTDHWLYNPDATSGFHRVGFYSNVDEAFLPVGRRDRVSIYVERAYPGGRRPSDVEVAAYSSAVVAELQEWGFIGEAEVVDPTWIDVAYTWTLPGSRWRKKALDTLESHGVYQIGRYGRWTFQGIADSLKDGFFAGQCISHASILSGHSQATTAAR